MLFDLRHRLLGNAAAILLLTTSCGDTTAIRGAAVWQYQDFVLRLEANNPDSITAARVRFLDSTSALNAEDAELLYMVFRKFYFASIETINTELSELQSAGRIDWGEYGTNRKAEQAFDQKLARNGLTRRVTEGSDYVDESVGYHLKEFGPYVSESVRSFLSLRDAERQLAFQEDASLQVTFQVVASRCVSWEEFLSKYPKSAIANEALSLFEIYLDTLLNGTNNTRVLQSNREYVDPVVAHSIDDAYTWILTEHSTSIVAFWIKQYYPLVKNSGFTTTDEISALLHTRGAGGKDDLRRFLR